MSDISNIAATMTGQGALPTPPQVAVNDPNADIHVNPSELRAVLVSTLTLVGFALSFATAIAGFVANRDLAAAIVYLKDQQTVAGLVSLAGGALYVWRMVAVKRRKQTEVVLAIRAPGAALTAPVAPHVVENALSPPRARETETTAPEFDVDALLRDAGVPATDRERRHDDA